VETLVAPTSVEYVEVLQGVQYASLVGAATDEYFPAAHVLQNVLPEDLSENLPCGQAKQAVG
jgi:hypothetical protein